MRERTVGLSIPSKVLLVRFQLLLGDRDVPRAPGTSDQGPGRMPMRVAGVVLPTTSPSITTHFAQPPPHLTRVHSCTWEPEPGFDQGLTGGLR